MNNDLNTCGAVVNYSMPTAPVSTSGNQTFNYTGDMQIWTVPAGVTTLTIEAFGGQGMSGEIAYIGGLGARMRGDFTVTPGDQLIILTGSQGINLSGNGGGGGGSFVVKVDPNSSDVIASGPFTGLHVTPLLIAGGGGGTREEAMANGNPGVTTNTATGASADNPIGGGFSSNSVPGTGGIVSSDSWGSAGGGFRGDGASDSWYGTGGMSFLNGGAGGINACGDGGACGGFGSGGSGGGCYGGGGGGGYTGGDGGWVAGGGGSYNIGTNQNNTAGANIGDGSVTISWLGAGSITQTSGLPSGSIFPVGTTTNAFEATDASGNVTTSSFTVTVTDNELPTIICPASVTVNSDQGVCFATGVVLGAPITNDNCSVASVTNDAPTQFALGNNTVTWTVTDASGNINTCSQIVTVIDNELPGISCPANVTVDSDPGVCYATGVTLDTPITSDNCSVAFITNDAPTQFPVGDTIVTWTVTDGSGNISTCTQTVTVNSTIIPTVTIDASPNGPICAGTSVTFAATPTNTSGGTINYDFRVDNISVQSSSSNQFTTNTLVDGNSVNCYITITGSNNCLVFTSALSNSIVINVNPSISITSTSNNISVGNDLGVCQAMVTYPAATATGIPTPTITYSQDSGTIFPVGTTAVTVTATNTCGSVTSSFTVTVNDTEAPIITTPSDISVNNDINTCGAVVTYTAPTVLDNCVTSTSGNQTFNYSGSLQTWTVPAGVTSININGKGAQGGNTGGLGAQIRGDFAVTPGDVLNILVGQMGTLSINDNGGGGGGTFIWKQDGNVLFIAAGGGGGRAGNSNGSFGGDGSADTTPNDSINGSGNGASGTLGNGGVGGTCDWIFCDSYGIGTGGGGSGWLSNGLAGTGTSNDATGGNSPLNNGAGGSGYNDCQNENVYGGYGGGGGGGGCSGAGGGGGGYNGGGGGNSWNGDTWGSGAGGGSYNIGTNQNNTAGANIGDGSVTISWLGASSITQTSGLPSGSVFPVGTTINTFEATDASGNVATSSFLVTVTDNELPTIICPVSVSVNSDPGVCFATGVILDMPLTGDNCSVVSVTNDAPSQFPVGDTVVTWTVIDASGNANTCAQTVTVNSTIVPIVSIDSSPSGPICAGATVIFTATASNVSDGIVNYNFMVNGNSVQNGISNTFSSSSLLNDDVVTCEINISNTNCLAATIAGSNSILLIVNPQPTQPTIACYETATFNTATCSWDVTGTQPIQPTLACYESATFNTTSCSWDVTGTQPAQPTLACYESATFNTTSCSWDVSGTAPDAPTGDIVQTFSVASLSDATLSSLVVNPNTVIWYASLNEALNGSNPLPNTTILTNGSTYYAVNIVSGCSSTPFAVTVSVTLGIDSYEMNSIYIYPNPTTSILNIQSSIPVDKIVITDMLGKILRIQTTNTTKVDVEQFAEGTYIIETTYGEKKFISKFIKK